VAGNFPDYKSFIKFNRVALAVLLAADLSEPEQHWGGKGANLVGNADTLSAEPDHVLDELPPKENEAALGILKIPVAGEPDKAGR
jgi:hypothetical protein